MRKRLAKVPKGDRHNHLCLCVDRRTLKERYGRSPVFPSAYDGLPAMIDFVHAEVNPIMATGEDVVAFMEMAIQDSLRDNVVRLEGSVDVSLVRHFDGSIDVLLQAVALLKKRYASFFPIIGVNKPKPLELMRGDIEACMESGLFSGIDLYGLEAGQDLGRFKPLYAAARRRGLNLKVHIGEFSDAASIKEAIELLEPDEIQHGIRSAEDREVIEVIVKNGIMLNICPASNLSLGAARDLGTHPIRKLFDSGVKISVNTDDLLLFDATITDQFVALLEEGIFTLDEIEVMRLNGLGA